MLALSGVMYSHYPGLCAYDVSYWDMGLGWTRVPRHITEIRPLPKAFTYVVTLAGNGNWPAGPLFVFVDLRPAIANNQDYGVLEFQAEAMVPPPRMEGGVSCWDGLRWKNEDREAMPPLVQHAGKRDVRSLFRPVLSRRNQLLYSAPRCLATEVPLYPSLLQYEGKMDLHVLIRRCVRRSLNHAATSCLPAALLDLVSQYV
jgi:hypothetical protein